MDEAMGPAGNFLSRVDRRADEVLSPAPGLVAARAPSSAAAEQYRVLFHRLDRARGAGPLKVVAVTSAVGGEGKSLTAANLALVAAAADRQRRVLLVDADLRRPSLALLLGIDGRPGLGDLLAGDATLAEVARRPRGSSLTVVPAGAPRDDAGLLVSGPPMRAFLDQARAHFDEVYLDVPPVLPVADGGLLASLSDGTILVVRAGSTPRSLVWQAIESLGGVMLLGCVLNGVEAGEVPGLGGSRLWGR